MDQIKQFLADASWAIVSSAAAPHACMEHRALRESWLAALEAAGMTEPETQEAARSLWKRAK